MKKVLIVDDEPGIVNMLTVTLETAGYQVVSATNGQDGMHKAGQHNPDIIISDILMPDMDGFEFFKELKKNKKTAQIPFIVLTARGQMEDSFKAVGVDDFLEKPSEPSELLQKVEALLKHKKSETSLSLHKKAIIAGNYKDVLEDMAFELRRNKCEVKIVTRGDEVIEEALAMKPEILVMEVGMTIVPSEEIIRVLRLLPKLNNLSILLYCFYELTELGSEVIQKEVVKIESTQKRCIDAGADMYLGRYNQNAFIKQLRPYLET